MQGAINLFKGSLRVQVKCKYPERAVNICAGCGVDFWELKRCDGGAEMNVSIEGYRLLKSAARDSGTFTVRPVRKRGVPFVLWRVRKRYVLLVGMVLCLLSVWVSTLFIWQIDVSGNETVPTSEILASLKKLGVDIGASVFSVSQERISNEMLLMIPELSWITLNTHGSRIEVLVREEVAKPEIRDPDVPTIVYAKKSGIITDMRVIDGKSLFELGDTVSAGDELVTGAMEGNLSGIRLVHADAEIMARTWYEMSLKMPLSTLSKSYTGRSKTRTAVIFGGKRINFYFSGRNPYASYDKMVQYETLALSKNVILPITVVKETYDEYETTDTSLTVQEAESILKARLTELLETELQDDGYAVKTDFVTRDDEGALTVTLYAECIEQIAGVRDMTDDEIDAANRLRDEILSGKENNGQ